MSECPGVQQITWDWEGAAKTIQEFMCHMDMRFDVLCHGIAICATLMHHMILLVTVSVVLRLTSLDVVGMT